MNEFFLLELRTDPRLGFQLTVPTAEGEGVKFFMPMDGAAARSLAFALLLRPEVNLPEAKEDLLTALDAAVCERQTADAQFLAELGVSA